MNLIEFIKKYNKINYYICFLVISLFLFFGIILFIYLIQSLFISYDGIGLIQFLHILISVYIIYQTIIKLKFLIKNKIKFNNSLKKFVNKNKKRINLTFILSLILLTIFYSNFYIIFNNFVNIILFLPIFVFQNLIFLTNLFLLKNSLFYLSPILKLILPISEVLYLYFISKLVIKQ